MKQRRGVFALFVLVMFASSIAVFAQKDDKKKDELQKRESQTIIKLVDDMAAGQPAPNDFVDHLAARRCAEGARQQGIRALHRVDRPGARSPAIVAFYWRVVSKNPVAPAVEAPPAGKDKKDDKKDAKKPSPYAYEDISFVPVTAGQNPLRISRSFTVPAAPTTSSLSSRSRRPRSRRRMRRRRRCR